MREVIRGFTLDSSLIGPTLPPIPPFQLPTGLTSTNLIYVTNLNNNNVSVIDGIVNRVIATIPVGNGPVGVGVNP
ncbi:exosporium leader peptide-containing protein [Bacillus cereus]|uniref:exosporium leader peptide-containing protein n=1 Tax=Bacillus cereus TaxID=1396 RepID=UPI00211D5018|nr:exosporium leader peptide-containing protein [Bacillus cereus]